MLPTASNVTSLLELSWHAPAPEATHREDKWECWHLHRSATFQTHKPVTFGPSYNDAAIKQLRLQKILLSDNSTTEMKILAGGARKSNLAITARLLEL